MFSNPAPSFTVITDISTCPFSFLTLVAQEAVPALSPASFFYNFLSRVHFQYSSKDRSDGCLNIVHSGHDITGIHCEQPLILWHSYKFWRLLEGKGTSEPTFGCIGKVFAASQGWAVFCSHLSLCSSVSFFCNCVELLPSPLCLNSLITLTSQAYW